MRNIKIYFNKEKIIETLNIEAAKEGSTITVKDMDEIVCLLRIVDKIKLDKKHKSVLFLVNAYNRTEIKLSFASHVIEKAGIYEIIRECMKDQLINKDYVTNKRFGYVLLGYDVEADDHDVIAALEISSII